MFRKVLRSLIRLAIAAAAILSVGGGTDHLARPVSAVRRAKPAELTPWDFLSQRTYLAKSLRIRSAKPRVEVAILLADTLRAAAPAVNSSAAYSQPTSPAFALHCSAGALLS